MRTIDRLVAAGVLFLPPILFAYILLFFVGQGFSIFSFSQYLVYVVAAVYYVRFLMTPPYDQRTFQRTLFPEAPVEVEELLKTQCKGRPIVKMIIEILSEHSKLNQSDIQRELTALGLSITYTTAKNHLDNMKDAGLVDAIEQPAYAKDFTLTQCGKWCADAIRIRLPSSHFRRFLLQCLATRPPPYPTTTIR